MRNAAVLAVMVISISACASEDDGVDSTHAPVAIVPLGTSCADLGFGASEVHLPPRDYVYAVDDVNTLRVSWDPSGTTFSFQSTVRIDAVLVNRAGTSAVWDLGGEADAYAGLEGPPDADGHAVKPGWVTFCYDYDLFVSTDAFVHYDRRTTWSIDVVASTLTLDPGQESTARFDITVAPSGSVIRNAAVDGPIYIDNATPFDATITGVTADVGGLAATVACPVAFPYLLAPGEVVVCSYQRALPDGADRTVTIDVATEGEVPASPASVAMRFASHTTQLRASTGQWVEVTAPGHGLVTVAHQSEGSHTSHIGLPAGPFASCGAKTLTASAFFRSFDSDNPAAGHQVWTGDSGSDSATAAIDVRCP